MFSVEQLGVQSCCLVYTMDRAFTAANIDDLLASMAAEGGQQAGAGLAGFLIDVRGRRNPESNSSIFFLANKTLARYPIFQQTRVAVLRDADDHSYNFAELAAQNAGYRIRLVSDPAKARAWLAGVEPDV